MEKKTHLSKNPLKKNMNSSFFLNYCWITTILVRGKYVPLIAQSMFHDTEPFQKQFGIWLGVQICIDGIESGSRVYQVGEGRSNKEERLSLCTVLLDCSDTSG